VTLDHGFDEPAPLTLVRHVARHGIGARDLLPQRGEAIPAAGGHDRDGAGAGERARQLLSEAGAGPGHDNHVAVEFVRHPYSRFEVTSVYTDGESWRKGLRRRVKLASEPGISRRR
jgi:hypothetical protein